MKRLGLDGGRLKWSHSDPGTDYTDRKLREVSNRLKDLYEEAANDLYMKQQSFIHGHAARVQKYLAKVEAGEMTRTDFEAWMQGQVFQGEQWAQKREQIARQMVDIDRQAQQIVNEGKLSVFAENANYMGWKLEKGAGANLGFGVYDRATVSRLVRDQPNLLPMPKINAGKDYAWYNGVVNRAVTQGIMQGEDLEDIVFRLSLETGEKGLRDMRRNARTAYTGAQNAGRLEGMRQARDKLGVKVKKRWIAFLDSHTRDAHAELDGEVADIDEPFNSKLGPIMCPGDPEAEPANVYNCRCTLEDYYPEYPDNGDRIDEDGVNVGDMSYKEWREMKDGKGFTFHAKDSIINNMEEVREASVGIVNGKRLYNTTPEIQAFTSVDSAVEYFRYTNRWGDSVSPIDAESFDGIKLSVLKEMSEGVKWAQDSFNMGIEMPRTIRRARLGNGVLGDYDDTTQEIRYKLGLTEEYAYSTAVHEMAHHADNIMGHPAVEIVKAACKTLRGQYSIKQINRMKDEIALEYSGDPHELLAYSLDKYCIGKGNILAKTISEDFLRRCREK